MFGLLVVGSLSNLGFGEAAEAQATLGLSTARKTNYDYAIASALTSSAWLAQMRQDTSETLTHAGQALGMADGRAFCARAGMGPARFPVGATEDDR